jgi:hypothetical protein
MGQYHRDVLLLKFFQQEPGLGAFATALATFKGDEQCQGLPRFPSAARVHAPLAGVEIAVSGQETL